MFKIATKSPIYQTYVLSDDTSLAEAEVVPERGGILTRWRIQGQDIFYLDEERFTHPDLSVRGGVPILFPICGNLPENLYIYQNKTYQLKQHGFARDLPWQVVEQNTDGSANLTLVLDSNDETKVVYPFDFKLKFRYELQGNRLSIQQRFTNLSNEIMPFATGVHPYFAAQDKSQLTFGIPSSQYQAKDSEIITPFTGSFNFDAEEIDVAFKDINRHLASFTDAQRKLKINLHFSEAYSTLVFWTVKGKDFICVEPWSSPRNSINTGEKQLYLEAGDSLDLGVTFSVES